MSELTDIGRKKMEEIAAQYNTKDDHSMGEITPEMMQKIIAGKAQPVPQQEPQQVSRIMPETQESPIFVPSNPAIIQSPTQPITQSMPMESPSQVTISHPAPNPEPEDEPFTSDSVAPPISKPKDKIIQTPESVKTVEETAGITNTEVIQLLKDMDPIEASKKAQGIMAEIKEFRKQLIIDHGLLPEEADKAARNRLNRTVTEANKTWNEEHPPQIDITVNKENVKSVDFTDEEKKKLTYAKRLRLVEVEDGELATIRIKQVAKQNLTQTMRRIEGSISRYSGPMPLTGDHMTFNGSQTMYLVSAVYSDDDSIYTTLSKKVALVYEKFFDGALIHKYDENGKCILNYTDFINRFSFYDVDLAVYYIYMASTMEDVTSVLPCGSCGNEWEVRYNTKSILRMDNAPDTIKEKIDFILSNSDNAALLEEQYLEDSKIRRLKSPITQNIYDVDCSPSVGKALAVFGNVDLTDPYLLYLSPIIMSIQGIMVRDPEDNQYINIMPKKTEDVTSAAFIRLIANAAQQIPETDIKLINEYIKNYIYMPYFRIEATCTACGHKNSTDFNIAELVFLHAQDTEVEIGE